jgi:hypothetical protein
MLNPSICPQCFQANEAGRSVCWKCMQTLTALPTEKDYLRIFGLRTKWSKDDLKASFRVMARKYHPDANLGDREAEAYFKFINQAYESLCKIADTHATAKETEKSSPKPKSHAEPVMDEELSKRLRACIKAYNAANSPKSKNDDASSLGNKFKKLWPFSKSA